MKTASSHRPVVFLFDVDNTLLDNDRVVADLRAFLEREERQRAEQYWTIFEQIRTELGYADYLGALQRYRLKHPHENLLAVSRFLVEYPFANRLYPNSLDVVERAKQAGRAAILSDGDVVFQPRKVDRSGLFEAFEGRVLIYVHKEQEMAEIQRLYPADHYVLVDDKLRILDAFKRAWGNRITTVFPKQGHYANDPQALTAYQPADISISRIGELIEDSTWAKLMQLLPKPA